MVRSFREATTERLWSRQHTKSSTRESNAPRCAKLVMLDAAETLDDLTVPRGNRLEALRPGRALQHSIRINQQWPICFVWTPAGPQDVEIVD
ncbi:MAG: type II toxin-antitoxin system RelE/ParE family toxin, partial [Nostocoides sp.]